MKLQQLPPGILELLTKLNAPPRLIAHLTLVHDVANSLVAGISENWPELEYDRQAVLIGAATHDIGKAIFKDELSQHGTRHEEIGEKLLLENNIPPDYARFAHTHAQWMMNDKATIEDFLVALADTIWKGKRDEKLEMKISEYISSHYNVEIWQVFMKFDDILTGIAKDADKRLAWQAAHPL